MILGAHAPERDRALLRLALSDDQQQRHLGEAVLAHLIVDLLVAKVGRDSDARGSELGRNLSGIIIGVRTIVATTA